MSDRTWLSRTQPCPERWRNAVDHQLMADESLESLAARVAWRLPAKLIGDDAKLIWEFLGVLDRKFNMEPADFWFIQLAGSVSRVEHPTWEELQAYLELASTVNSESPNLKKGEKAKE